MPGNDILGPTARDGSDWGGAWKAASLLSATRRIALYGVRSGDRAASILISTNNVTAASPSDIGAVTQLVPSGADQLARDYAEIQQAAAMLRRVDPALDMWFPDRIESGEPRKLIPIWVLVGSVWSSTILIFGGAVVALFYLLT